MGAQAPGAPAAAPAPGDQGQAPQASGGQPDYTKAWEEYYKKMGMSECELETTRFCLGGLLVFISVLLVLQLVNNQSY